MAMKEQTRKIFDYIKANNGSQMTSADVADALGLEKRSVDGSFTSFQKKGWGVRTEAEIELPDGTHKKVKFLSLTSEGMAYDPESDTAE